MTDFAFRLPLVAVQNVESLPDGVQVLTVACPDHDTFQTLPDALEFKLTTFGRTGWNSDRSIAYYRTDAALASAKEQ